MHTVQEPRKTLHTNKQTQTHLVEISRLETLIFSLGPRGISDPLLFLLLTSVEMLWLGAQGV